MLKPKTRYIVYGLGIFILIFGFLYFVSGSLVQNSGINNTYSSEFEAAVQKGGTYDFLDWQEVNLKSDKDRQVLFFKAGWCGSCTQLDTDLYNNRDQIPANLHIWEINYDMQKDLVKDYGVTIQHTLIQINNQGQEIQRWIGSTDLKHILDTVV